MELKVTQSRCNRMEVGTTFIVKGNVIPAWAVGKVEVVSDAEPEEEKTLIVNPENGGQPVAQGGPVGDGAAAGPDGASLATPVGAPVASAPAAPAPAAAPAAAPAKAK